MNFFKSNILTTGHYLPDNIVTNDDLSKIMDTSDEWIRERSGIRQRHKASDIQATSDLGFLAAKNALEKIDFDPQNIDMIICATTTPDLIFPSTASIIQKKLNIQNHCPAFDVQAVCAGFIFAVSMADQYIKTGAAKNILVIGAEILSRIIDYKDRATSVLFGDGAGAVLLSRSESSDASQILSTVLHTNGQLHDILKCKGGTGSFQNNFGFLTMNGKEVFKAAVLYLSQVMDEALKKADLSASDIDFIVPHQANQRIMDATAKKVGISKDKVISTIAQHGNTSAASVPLALDYAIESKMIEKGNKILIEAIGGGMSWGGSALIY